MRSRRPALAALAATGMSLAPSSAAAQTEVAPSYALSQLQPAPAGDAFFGVASPGAGGHLVPRAQLFFDYAREPLRLFGAGGESVIVESQAFLRLDASLALFERLLLSLDAPFAVAQGGQAPADPSVAAVDFHPPNSAEAGDLRLGARVRLASLGGEADAAPFQVGLGAYLHLPTAPAGSYAGEGAVRGEPHLILGGRLGNGTGFVWSASGGVHLRGSDNPHDARFAAGAAVDFGGVAQVGPELYGSAPLGGTPLSTERVRVESASSLNLELALGAKVRLGKGLVLGAAGGPGLLQAIGTPSFRAMALVAWAPAAEASAAAEGDTIASAAGDRDDDGFNDGVDACPDTPGDLQGDPRKDGCPKPDRDGDGVGDTEDACPALAGSFSSDGATSGCPQDRDGDAVADNEDACPNTKGKPSPDPKLSGCPDDRDGDGVGDAADACPTAAGKPSADPKQSGCPEDPDGDGLVYSQDACPNERGAKDPDPEKSGCPKYVRVVGNEIVLLKPIRFRKNGRRRGETIDPVSDDILTEVRDVIQQHPEILEIEVQGHADDDGKPEYNEKLSLDRAENVKAWLVKAGVPASVLVTKGYGSTVPLGDNRIAAGRLKNRRVQFIIVKKK